MIEQKLLQFDGAYKLAERLKIKGCSNEDGWMIKSIVPITDSTGCTCGFYVLVEREIKPELEKELFMSGRYSSK